MRDFDDDDFIIDDMEERQTPAQIMHASLCSTLLIAFLTALIIIVARLLS